MHMTHLNSMATEFPAKTDLCEQTCTLSMTIPMNKEKSQLLKPLASPMLSVAGATALSFPLEAPWRRPALRTMYVCQILRDHSRILKSFPY